MKNRAIWLDHPEVQEVYEGFSGFSSRYRHHHVQTQPAHKADTRADWFPGILHSISFGKLNLFQLVSGPEKDLGPNQKELKKFIWDKAHNHEAPKFPTLIDVEKNISKEELARKIMTHFKHGSSDMIFLPTLPMSPRIKRDHKKKPPFLNIRFRIPVGFPIMN